MFSGRYPGCSPVESKPGTSLGRTTPTDLEQQAEWNGEHSTESHDNELHDLDEMDEERAAVHDGASDDEMEDDFLRLEKANVPEELRKQKAGASYKNSRPGLNGEYPSYPFDRSASSSSTIQIQRSSTTRRT
jgi:hypothetical protein